MKRILLAAVLITLACLLKGEAVSAWWNTSWTYSQGGNISADAGCGLLHGYEVRLNLDYSSGASTGNTTYTNGHSQTDFSDVRFVLNGTVLPHWFEQVNDGVSAIVWVNFSSIPVAVQNFSIYYGNPTAPDVSEGNTTWNFFDDFMGATLSPQWHIDCGDPLVAVAGGLVTVTNVGGGQDTIATTTFCQSEYRYMSNVTIGAGQVNWGLITPAFCSVVRYGAGMTKTLAGAERCRRDVAVVGTTWDHPFPAATFTSRILFNGTWARWYYNDVKVENQGGFILKPLYLFLGAIGTDGRVMTMDWVAVGDMCRPEPSLGIWSAENMLILGPPSDFIITELGGQDVQLDWTIGLNSENTLIRMKANGYPESITDGQLVYFGAGNTTTDTGLALETTTYYYRAWSNAALLYAGPVEAQIGGSMIQFGVIAFIAMGTAVLAFWQRKVWIFFLAGIAWFGMGMYCFIGNSPGDVMWGFGWLGVVAAMVLFFAPMWYKERELPERTDSEMEYRAELREIRRKARARKRGEDD